MASLRRFLLPSGTVRYKVRWRANGEPFERRFKTRDTAERFKRTIEAEELRGVAVDPRAGDVTFEAYAERWIEARLVKGRPLAPMTRQGYVGLLERHLNPAFGTIKLRRIGSEEVQAWYAHTTRTAGRSQAAKGYRLLRAIMNSAVHDDRIGRNPCRLKGAGIEAEDERPMVPTDVVLHLADAIRPDLRAFVLLSGFGSLRTGELLGLQRQDIDEPHSAVMVRRQAQEVSRRRAGTESGRIIGDPKSEAGKRVVQINPFVMKAVVEHLRDHAPAAPAAFLFHGRRDPTEPLRRARLSEAWQEAVARVADAPPGLRIHDLRHHAATLTARSPGTTTKELMARIGHSSPRAALRYQHATEERDRRIADYMEQAIEKALAEAPPRAEVVALSDEAPPTAAWFSRGAVRPGSRGKHRSTPSTQGEHSEAAGGIEPPYGALQAPA